MRHSRHTVFGVETVILRKNHKNDMNNHKNKLFALLLLLMLSLSSSAQYRNPIIYADVLDVSLVWHDGYYYMVSTTMHLMPGCPVMRSRDLKHWTTVSYVFDTLEAGQDRYNLRHGKTIYGQGQWASSIRYHDGQFWVWFTANGEPYRGFLYTAKKAEGPWRLVARPPHFHDGSLFFDDDGRVYMFHGTGSLTELDPKTFDKKAGGIDTIIFERDSDEQALLEGSSAFKYQGKYYLCMISMDWSIPGRLRREVCYRADRITGPYTKKIILETPFETFGGVGQGCLVSAGPDGPWHAVIFQDRGGIGRVPCLMPVTWRDGWPMCGDAEGHIPNDTTLRHIHQTGILGSDAFSGHRLSRYWQVNHIPDAGGISLQKGWLRLATTRVVPNIYLAPNTVTQRTEGPRSRATVRMDISHMKEGDEAGLAVFNSVSGLLKVRRTAAGYTLMMTEENSIFQEPDHSIAGDSCLVMGMASLPEALSRRSPAIVYLRADADFTAGIDTATFAYSLDNKTWHPIGGAHHMLFDYTRMFMGSKFALFNYATRQTGGHVAFDWFHYDTY